MAADLARITYDPTRQYRSVITQQGRVTLEADNNEAAIIAGEALRLETIDIVGPTGTPDDGYKVGTGNGTGGVSIGPGTFYLGGWRLELDAAIDLSAQPDWLDMPPVASVPPATTATAAGVLGNRLVALLLTEQSVCAVEDQALREVALGGPDSAARARLMQQFLRLPLDGTTCPAGAAMISALLSAQGITIDPDTLQLMSAATLQAGFVPGPPATDPCTPAAAGGYLGADNQLVRVTVTAYDATAKTGTLLWGWNNASLLYRAKMTDPRTLTLTGTPVDEEHAPQLGQAVEILRSRANLGDGNFIAAPEGFVTTLTQAYSFDTGELQLAVALPAEYQADKNPLFVRLWQASVPFNAGQVTPLDATSGITVNITLPALPTSIALRPFWRFAVRPATPVNIYPQRYQETPQPPDGPRQWLADLAVVQAVATGSRLLADCRVPFLPLTQQTGACCGLVLGPKDVAGRGGLQAVMDKLAGTQSSVALRAGTYTLSAPLALGQQHSGLTLEACGPGVVLAANAANLAVFRFGLVVMNQASNVTLRGLTFTIPNVPLPPTPTPTPTPTPAPTVTTNPVGTPVPTNTLTLLNDRVVASTGTANAAGLAINPLAVNTGTASASGVAINPAALNTGTANPAGLAINQVAVNAAVVPATIAGVMAVSSPGLTIEECQFNVSPASPYVFGAELILYGDATGLSLRRNQFAAAQYQPGAMVYGVLATVLNGNANSTLDSAEITDNLFQQLPAGLAAFSQLGMVRCTGNRVVQCGAGLYFATSNTGATGEVLRQAAGDATQSATLAPALTAGMQPMMLASVLTQSSAFAAKAPAAPTTTVSADARTVLLRDVATRGAATFRSLIPSVTSAQQTAAPATGTAPAAPAAAPAIDANLNTALNQVRDMSIAAELAGVTLLPVLHLSGNDVALIATQTTPGVGIAVVLSPGGGGGTVLMTANRVVTPDTRTEAAAILFPTVAAVTGNVFLQTGEISQPVIPALMLAAEAAAQIEATANVIHFAALVAPARSNAAATTTWNFLNTVG